MVSGKLAMMALLLLAAVLFMSIAAEHGSRLAAFVVFATGCRVGHLSGAIGMELNRPDAHRPSSRPVHRFHDLSEMTRDIHSN